MPVYSVRGTQNQLFAVCEEAPLWKKVALRVALFFSAIGSFFKVMYQKLVGRKDVSYKREQDHCRFVFQRCLGFPEVHQLNFLTKEPVTKKTLETFYFVAGRADVKRICLADANISFEDLKALVTHIAKELPACRHLLLPARLMGTVSARRFELLDKLWGRSEEEDRDYKNWEELDKILKEKGFQLDERFTVYSR